MILQYLKNAKNHFITITKHKLMVMDLCFKVGLYKQGLLHDLSKYLPVEFMTGIKYYQGIKSPNAAEKNEKGYSVAWLHHKGINKHHFEYWLDLTYRDGEKVTSAKMPLRYVIEMACDRIAACKTYHGADYTQRDPLDYYNRKADHVAAILHPDTEKMLRKILTVLDEQGEDRCIAYMRYLKNQEIS